MDDYLEFCKEVGKDPEREYKGTFNVRISPELHKKLALRAFKDGCSLNAAVESAMQSFGYLILQEHMKTCMTEEVQSGNTEVVDEVLELMKKLK